VAAIHSDCRYAIRGDRAPVADNRYTTLLLTLTITNNNNYSYRINEANSEKKLLNRAPTNTQKYYNQNIKE